MFARVFNFTRFSWRNLFVWSGMSFQAGVINSGGFIGCHRFVSHTTGFATAFGEAFAKAQWNLALEAAGVPMFFLVGVMISAYLIDGRTAQGKSPLYSLTVFLIVMLMILAVGGGLAGWFGDFASTASSGESFPLLAILCLACGIQNASITSASGSSIRTTHLTGITTDLGIGIIRWVHAKRENPNTDVEKKANITRVALIAAFIAGSTLGTIVFLQFKYLGYLIPVLISGTFLSVDLFEKWQRHRAKAL
jgi:uncharacterized membrane protein YoaK (UPF0700 family)